MIPTSQGNMSVAGVLAELSFISYSSNRDRGMTAEQLARWFGPTISAAMESRYKAEQQQRRAA